ncbi:MAG: TolC family protein [Planctomycetes bacterium]|nr:TolC family protein [Planctomycetota bacterium]
MPRPNPLPIVVCLALGGACWSPIANKESADEEVYSILARTTEQVTGQARPFVVERPIDTLRQRLERGREQVRLDLQQALDVAAENSREFQRQKEQLYLAALNLTRNRHDFATVFGAGGSGEVAGEADQTADATLRDDLSASSRSTSGMRIVGSFVNTFLRSVVHGGSFDGSSILNLTITQPLLRGAGSRIVREPLTQSERDVVYAVRDFERFRATFAVDVVSAYYDIVQQMEDLKNVEANYASVHSSRLQTEELYAAGRRTISDLGREKQSELTASNSRVQAQNRLASALDRFKITLGLPTTAHVELDPGELDNLVLRGVTEFRLDEQEAIELALARRYDYRTNVDEVEDAGRRVVVAEDALRMSLDFTAALNVPAEAGPGLNLDWSKVNWSAGFELDLALDKLVERNAYRSALISFDSAMRARENAADGIASAIRTALRNIESAFASYTIQVEALKLAETRVESTSELYAAGRTGALDVLDAKDALLQAQLNKTSAIIDYAIARLELVRDLEGLALEAQGLRFDPSLPMPTPSTEEKP